MHLSARQSVIALVMMILATPLASQSFPFGGQTRIHYYCYNPNPTIYAFLGPPRGGPYLWTSSTRTYQFGPPRGVGQWLLGLTGPPYYCIVTRSPLHIEEGMSIMMMGSSGPSAGGFRSTPPPSAPPPSAPPPGTNQGLCQNRTQPPANDANDPCDDPNLTCEQMVQRGYRYVARCPGTF